ncbi:Rap1a/Tai family immunity protein [Paremcibacter congregatus]|uniref:Rap1a immunity protein domain-containing protein n=1 Tax=Paremcibacter congregatus TaxID=2043170 RepID=A0A2G4YSX9_9PROT|nr:Rap1a/Tai family immunity protein [Paremcibacter congregatus]PHZ84556.1 hypothetical protein CRD36_12185 [Paremcibacter congregatus]QDE28776.1 DUF72 domain-containing protein [Paremcibacter congregatus]
MRILLACMMLLGAAPAEAKTLTVAEALAIEARVKTGHFGAQAEMLALGHYVQGMIEGNMSYYHRLRQDNTPTRFCLPTDPGFSFSMQAFFKIMHERKETERDTSAAEAVLQSFETHYPCQN